MSFEKCIRCNGTGKLNMMGRVEEAAVCCDGGTYYCDICGHEIPDGDVFHVNDKHVEHLCDTCSYICNECGSTFHEDNFNVDKEHCNEYHENSKDN